MKKNLLLVFILFSFLNLQAGISGSYKVKGKYPNGTSYEGTVDIHKQNEVYFFEWFFKDRSQEVGTGLCVDDQISVIFHGLFGEDGVQIYSIKPKKQLEGPWVNVNSTEQGYEKLTKIN